MLVCSLLVGILQKDAKGISVLEALAATGLRAIRYAKEVDGIGQIVANDLDSGAVECMRRNIDFNDVHDKVTPCESDARLVMLQHCQVCIAHQGERSLSCSRFLGLLRCEDPDKPNNVVLEND
jgi:tRNA G26 N,N-dimethylase Trm1